MWSLPLIPLLAEGQGRPGLLHVGSRHVVRVHGGELVLLGPPAVAVALLHRPVSAVFVTGLVFEQRVRTCHGLQLPTSLISIRL